MVVPIVGVKNGVKGFYHHLLHSLGSWLLGLRTVWPFIWDHHQLALIAGAFSLSWSSHFKNSGMLPYFEKDILQISYTNDMVYLRIWPDLKQNKKKKKPYVHYSLHDMMLSLNFKSMKGNQRNAYCIVVMKISELYRIQLNNLQKNIIM